MSPDCRSIASPARYGSTARTSSVAADVVVGDVSFGTRTMRNASVTERAISSWIEITSLQLRSKLPAQT